MWPFEEISGYFYYLANKKRHFSIEIENSERFDKFSAYAPKNYTVEEWAELIHTKLEQYDLEPNYSHICDMHTSLMIWSLTTKDKEAIQNDHIPAVALQYSPILKQSLDKIQMSKAPSQIPQ